MFVWRLSQINQGQTTSGGGSKSGSGNRSESQTRFKSESRLGLGYFLNASSSRQREVEMKPAKRTNSLAIMKKQIQKQSQSQVRLFIPVVVALFCYHVVSAEHRIAGGGVVGGEGGSGSGSGRGDSERTNRYLRDFVGPVEASASWLKSSSIQQRQANEQQGSNEDLSDGSSGGTRRYTVLYDIRDIGEEEESKPNSDQWELEKIGELLESMSMSLQPSAGREQIQRNGRTYLFGADQRQLGSAAGSAELASGHNRYAGSQSQPQPRRQSLASSNQKQQQQQQLSLPVLLDLGQRQTPAGSGGSEGLPILWPAPTRSTSSGGPQVGTRALGGRRSHLNPHHTSDTAEVAIHTPLYSRSMSDYEWKRVENSRWNNLRGMWGKRSVGAQADDTGRLEEQESNELGKKEPPAADLLASGGSGAHRKGPLTSDPALTSQDSESIRAKRAHFI